jgi:hypothetical protein
MTINRWKRRGAYRQALLRGSIFSVLLVVAMGPTAQAFADESISVTCYNLQNSEIPVGNAIVYDTAQAASACNSLYYDCRGKCVGCFTDQDYLDSVCVDMRGTMFLK